MFVAVSFVRHTVPKVQGIGKAFMQQQEILDGLIIGGSVVLLVGLSSGQPKEACGYWLES